MGDWTQVTGAVVAMLTLLGAIFNFSVIKPLNQSVRGLRDCIYELRYQLKDTEAKRQQMAERLTRVEDAAAYANQRLDKIERDWKDGDG